MFVVASKDYSKQNLLVTFKYCTGANVLCMPPHTTLNNLRATQSYINTFTVVELINIDYFKHRGYSKNIST